RTLNIGEDPGVFTDIESARTTDRARFKEMLHQARAGRFDVLIVHKLDRFSRSVVDQLNAFDALTKADVGFVSATEGNFDFSTPAGRLQMTVLGAVNEWCVNNLSAEVSEGLKARAEARMWLGEVPFGYDCDYKKDGGNGKAYPNEEEAEGVRLAFEAYATGVHSYRNVAQILNETGYRPNGRGERALRLFSKDSVDFLLANRFYIGEVEYAGQHYPGLHEPIVSRELFERVQKVRERRDRGGASAPRKSRVYPLTGIARCARCGTPMRGSSSSGRRYYRDPAPDRCRKCNQRMVRALEAEDAVGCHLRAMSLPSEWKEQVLDTLQSMTKDIRDVFQQRDRCERQLERLKRLFVLGDISEPEYQKQRDDLQARMSGLEPPKMPDLGKAAYLVEDIGAIWDEATLEEEKQIAHTLLEGVHLDCDEGAVVRVDPKPAFKPLFKSDG
ncbi:MAG: recombinase family protein, partial [Chloroflexota bacterium]|nr:recombinase family protein [Chloroflexota bacterium]